MRKANFKSILFNRVLPELKAASPYFTVGAIKQQARFPHIRVW